MSVNCVVIGAASVNCVGLGAAIAVGIGAATNGSR